MCVDFLNYTPTAYSIFVIWHRFPSIDPSWLHNLESKLSGFVPSDVHLHLVFLHFVELSSACSFHLFWRKLHSRALIVGWDFIQPTPFRIPCYRDVVQGRHSADHFRQSSICTVLLFKHIHWLIRWSLATLCWRWLVSLCQLFHQPFLGLPPDWGCGAARDPLVRGATRWTLARGATRWAIRGSRF